MSELSDLILPSGLVLGGLYLVKRYTEQTGQGDFTPIGKTCIGPICWSTYGPPVVDTPVITPIIQPDQSDPRDLFCNWPGSSIVFPPCFGYTYRGYS